MTSQMKYNTKLQIFLTQFLIYLIDEKEVTYESFAELMDISKSQFSIFIKEFFKMINDLRLRYQITKDQDEYIDDKGHVLTYIYHLNNLDIDYHFEYEHLNEEALVKYSMTIVYLMLRNKQYVTTNLLTSIFPNFNKKTMFNLLSKLKEIIPGEIDKNQLLSYVIELD